MAEPERVGVDVVQHPALTLLLQLLVEEVEHDADDMDG